MVCEVALFVWTEAAPAYKTYHCRSPVEMKVEGEKRKGGAKMLIDSSR